MTQSLIPPTPTAEDYEAVLEANTDDAIFALDEPFGLMAAWLVEARSRELNDSNAMALATVDADGLPDCRMVLLKDVDERGLVFYSNAESAKGRQLAAHPRAALLFHWKSLRRQIRVRGPVEPASDAEADAYFASRARQAQLGAWASDQSRPLESRERLEARIAELDDRFAQGEVPRPPHWRGWRLVPSVMEFWRDRPYRLHDRLVFKRAGPAQPWTRERLYP